MLGLGTTPKLYGWGDVTATLIIGAYFGKRTFENVARIIKRWLPWPTRLWRLGTGGKQDRQQDLRSSLFQERVFRQPRLPDHLFERHGGVRFRRNQFSDWRCTRKRLVIFGHQHYGANMHSNTCGSAHSAEDCPSRTKVIGFPQLGHVGF